MAHTKGLGAPMNYPFDVALEAGPARFGRVSGIMVIGRDPFETPPPGATPQWVPLRIIVRGEVGAGDALRTVDAVLPDTSDLWEPIINLIVRDHEAEIDALWADVHQRPPGSPARPAPVGAGCCSLADRLSRIAAGLMSRSAA